VATGMSTIAAVIAVKFFEKRIQFAIVDRNES